MLAAAVSRRYAFFPQRRHVHAARRTAASPALCDALPVLHAARRRVDAGARAHHFCGALCGELKMWSPIGQKHAHRGPSHRHIEDFFLFEG